MRTSLASLLVTGVSTPPVPPAVGTFWEGQGGYYTATYTWMGARYALVLAEKSAEASWSSTTGSYTTAWASATAPAGLSTIDGKNNTALYQAQHATKNKATKHCVDYRGGGYDDWYLPSFWEMEMVCSAFKPTTDLNTTLGDTTLLRTYQNPYTLTPLWTDTSPTQTTVSAFISLNAQAFTATGNTGCYLTSCSVFNTGSAVGTDQSLANYVRIQDLFFYNRYSPTDYVFIARPVRRVYLGPD